MSVRERGLFRVLARATVARGPARLLALPLIVALFAALLAPEAPGAAPPYRGKLPVAAPNRPKPPPEGAARFEYSERVGLGLGTLMLNGGLGASAAGMSALGMAFQELGTLRAGEQFDCWKLFDTDEFRPFPRLLKADVKDGFGVGGRGPEAEAYEQILIQASLTTPRAFAGAADLTLSYAHLFNSPELYRGKVAHVEGRLRKINRFEPPGKSLAEGVHDVYEAWIINDHLGANPYCVLFTNWPPGLSRDHLGKPLIDQKIIVSFDGYFFKKYRYESVDSKRGGYRDAPLLIGNSLVVRSKASPPPPPPNEPSWVKNLLYVFVGLLGGTAFLVGGLTWWYRRADRTVQRRLQAARAGELVLPPPDALPIAPPVRDGDRGHGPDRHRKVLGDQTAATRWGDRTGERGGQTTGPGKGAADSIEGKDTGPDPGEDAGA